MATLTVTGRSDVAGVAADVDDVAASVRGLGDDVARVDDVARTSGGGLDALGEASDNVASRSSQAAGGLGDLAGGLSAIGATGAGTALEGVALAAQTAVGAGDILNLVAETTVGRYVAQTAASIAHRTATIAGTVATGAMTAAQTALNVVMAANPILLVVIAVTALVAAVILAYRHSETFREIVDGAFSRARDVVEDAAAAVQGIIGWFRDLPGEAREAWGAVSEVVGDKIDSAVGFVDDLTSAVVDGPREVAGEVAGHFSDMFAPILTAVGWVQDLIDKIKSIDFPDFPDIPGVPGLRVGGGEGIDPNDPRLTGVAPVLLGVNLTVTRQDQEAATKDLIDGLREYLERRGQKLTITEAPAA